MQQIPPVGSNCHASTGASRTNCTKLHYVRDVTCCEDQGRTNAGHAPQVLAALRNTVLTLLRHLGFRPVEGFE